MIRRAVWTLAAACAVLACVALYGAVSSLSAGRVTKLVALQPPGQMAPTAKPLTGGINVNTASVQELMTLPGIGPVTAKHIVEAREVSPFYYPEDLKAVRGIGDKRLEQIRPFISVP